MIDLSMHSVFELSELTRDPRFEGFGLKEAPSVLGRDDLTEDFESAYGLPEDQRLWSVQKFAKKKPVLKVAGRVAPYNDYPCLDMIIPVLEQFAGILLPRSIEIEVSRST